MMAWRLRLMIGALVSLVAVFVAACAPPPPAQGPPVDLEATARPVPLVSTPPPPLPPRPAPPQDTLEVWVPRAVSPQGDAMEGHWELLSTTAPLPESREPSVTLPRTPSTLPLPKAVPPQHKPTPTPAPAPVPPPVPQAQAPTTWGSGLDPSVLQRPPAPATPPGTPWQGGLIP
jgi:hypothetical protein